MLKIFLIKKEYIRQAIDTMHSLQGNLRRRLDSRCKD